ncbi:hypothetical protein ACO1O0_003348 [Amphichorda felina]
MSTQKGGKDYWDSGKYQHSASYVPKLAGKVVEWLDLQKDDVVLDIGCGGKHFQLLAQVHADSLADGILDLEFSNVLAQGSGSVYGIDSSAAMIKAAQDLCKDTTNTTFEVLDATSIPSNPALQQASFTKAFSNAALHWVLRDPASRAPFFATVHAALKPGGTLALEMGGLGNVAEMRTALLLGVSRRVGIARAAAAEPWFFPDEAWLSGALREAGFRVERVERDWRPTTADKGGVEGWVRMFGKRVLEVVEDEAEREEVVREVAAVLKEVCRMPGGGEMISYVRLRALATKV